MTTKNNDEGRKAALKIARLLGINGAHMGSDGKWMPGKNQEEFAEAIQHSAKFLISGEEDLSKESDNRAAAETLVKTGYWAGVRTVIRDGKPMYSAKRRKRKDWEELGQRGVVSIDTLPGGGLVSGKNDIAYDAVEIDSKGFVNHVSRSTDPDVFTNPDSARVRSRQLGCIGIRSYTASDGKTVWLPCTNTPDYNRAMNLRPDGRLKKPTRERRSRMMSKSIGNPLKNTKKPKKTGKRTPAPKKDRIFGSTLNAAGSASSSSSAREIDMSSEIINSLAVKLRQHNAEMKKANKPEWSQTNLRALKAVYRRGAGAFSRSHRPGMTRNQWAMGRVNAFLRILRTGKPKTSAYKTDNDLLPQKHPWRKRSSVATKSMNIDGVEYLIEHKEDSYSYRRNEILPVSRFVCSKIDGENLVQ